MRDYRGKGWTAATSLVVLTALAAFAAVLVSSSSAAPAVAPNNVGEPSISGTPRVGQVLRSTRGTWTGTAPITYNFRWFRCDGRGASDASDCARITNASDNTYVLRQGDAGFRIRSQVVARNADGQDTATSNPTNVVTAAKPVNTTEPSISGTAKVGSTLQANRGQWAGDAPITYTYVWLRCNDKGDNCSEIQGANDPSYEVRDADTGRTIRVRVIARNDRGSTSAISNSDRSRGLESASAAVDRDSSRWRLEGSWRSPRRSNCCLLAQPGDEPHPTDHGSRARHCPWRTARERRVCVHARDTAGRRGSDLADGR